MTVRDFVYLDIERVKSIIAQVEAGYVDTAARSRSQTAGLTGAVEGGLLTILKGTAEAQSLKTTEESETRSLHDYIYNRVEKALVDHGLLREIPNDMLGRSERALHDQLRDTDFILARGMVHLNDYARARELLQHYNELGAFIARASVESAEAPSTKAKRELLKAKLTRMNLDKQYLKGMQLWFDVFYGARLVVKMMALPGQPNARLVGSLLSEYLRDARDAIVFKYTSRPTSEWTMLAQVAAVPPPVDIDAAGDGGDDSAEGIDHALSELFEAVSGLEIMAHAVKYPEVSVTPIALYREHRRSSS